MCVVEGFPVYCNSTLNAFRGESLPYLFSTVSALGTTHYLNQMCSIKQRL